MTDPATSMIDPSQDTMTGGPFSRTLAALAAQAQEEALAAEAREQKRDEKRRRGRPLDERYDAAENRYIAALVAAGLADAAGQPTAAARQSRIAAVPEARAGVRRAVRHAHQCGRVITLAERAMIAAEAAALAATNAELGAADQITAGGFRQALRVRGVAPQLILAGRRHAADSADGRPSPYPQRVRLPDPVATARRQCETATLNGPEAIRVQNKRWAADFRAGQRSGR